MGDDLMMKMLINDGAVVCMCYLMMKTFGDRLDKINDSINELAEKLGKRIDLLEKDVHELSFRVRSELNGRANGGGSSRGDR